MESGFKARWQSVSETFAIVIVALVVLWTALDRYVFPRTPAGRVVQAAAAGPRPAPPLPTTPLALQNAMLFGSPNAPVAMVMYSDFQCPFCARFARETLPALRTNYADTGRVVFAFRHFPLPNHAFAEKAADAAECAGRQNRFWEFHDSLFRDQQHLDDASLVSRARDLKMSTDAFTQCLSGDADAKVRADRSAGEPLGVDGTPAFFIGTQRAGVVTVARRISGAQPLTEFTKTLDEVLAQSEGKRK